MGPAARPHRGSTLSNLLTTHSLTVESESILLRSISILHSKNRNSPLLRNSPLCRRSGRSVSQAAAGVSVRCDAEHDLDSSDLLQRIGLEAITATCIAACVDAEAFADLAAQPITFSNGKRSSWAISTRYLPCISASCAWTTYRRHLLAPLEVPV